MKKILLCLLLPYFAHAKEIALSFDDVPYPTSLHYESKERTKELIRKLEELNIPPTMIFANPCPDSALPEKMAQLRWYAEHGHLVNNHTCTHPRLSEVGFFAFAADAKKADGILTPLMSGQKFFRYPFLEEGSTTGERDLMRDWLAKHRYRNGMVSADNEDHLYSLKINQAKQLRMPIDYEKVKKLFLRHIITSLECNEALAMKTIGYSPKHVLLLHERDATVMFLDSLVGKLREKGWKIISTAEAYRDPIYSSQPRNIQAGFGIINQLSFEKTGKLTACYDFAKMKAELNKALAL